MTIFLAATGLIIIYSISAFGWGRLATTYAYANPTTRSVAFEISVGLAIWGFIGGALNALGLAYAVTLNIIFLLGILLFGIILYTRLKEKRDTPQNSLKKFHFFQDEIEISKILKESIPVLLIISATSYLIITLLPSNAFNHHDDFYTYFPRIFRMLQTGQLGDALSFDYLGSDSLGAHPFLQAFVLSHVPLKYINGFDTVYCFLLGGLLLNDIGRWSRQHWFFRSAAIAAFFIINPQYVNTSALYSGSLMILALIFSSLLLYESLEKAKMREMLLAALIFAFIASTLVALKNTFVPFAVLYSILLYLLLFLFTKPRKKIALSAGMSAAMTGIMLAPWFWSVHEKFAFFFNANFKKVNSLLNKTNHGVLSPEQPGTGSSVLDKLFSSEKLFYGGNASDYSFIILCTLAASLWAGYLLIKKKEIAHKGNLIVVISVGVSAFIAFLTGAHLTNFDAGIRYSCPIIIATFPALSLLFAERSELKQTELNNHRFRAKQYAVMMTLGICIGLFITGWYGRLNLLAEYKSMLAYPITDNYITYNKNFLSKDEQESILSIQTQAEKEMGILAWFETTFFLDFKRNSVFAITKPTFISRFSSLTVSDLADGEKLGNYLRSVGIRYVIWGYKGAVKQRNPGTAELTQGLLALSNKSHFIYNDGKRALFDISDVKP